MRSRSLCVRSKAQLEALQQGRLKWQELCRQRREPCSPMKEPRPSPQTRPRTRASARGDFTVNRIAQMEQENEGLKLALEKTKMRSKLQLQQTRQELSDTKQHLQNTEQSLERAEYKLNAMAASKRTQLIELCRLRKLVQRACPTLTLMPITHQPLYPLVRTARRKAQRAIQEMRTVKEQRTSMENLVHALEGTVQQMKAGSEEQLSTHHMAIEELSKTVMHHEKTIEASRTKIRDLQQRCRRSLAAATKYRSLMKKSTYMRSRQQPMWSLKAHGVYSPGARAFMRKLVRSGCAPSSIPKVIRMASDMFGVHIKGPLPSRRTIGRIILEGGVAAEVQLGYELEKTASYTYSSDGTTHRNETIESRHIAFARPAWEQSLPPDSSQGDSNARTPGTPKRPSKHVIRLLGVEAAVNHTAETQFEGFVRRIKEINSVFSSSPLAQREGLQIHLTDAAVKLRGMTSDHAKDQQKVFALLKDWKQAAVEEQLGADAMLTIDWDRLRPLIESVNGKKIAAAGGVDAWNALSSDAQLSFDHAAMQELRRELGRECWKDLSETVKRDLTLMLWSGCCMHKDLNAVKGGAKAMEAAWMQMNLTPPILLPNRDNDATLSAGHITSQSQNGSEIMTEAEQRAFHSSSRGGVKLAALAGAVFNHKDDKKGQQNAYRYYMQTVLGHPCTFPDTSNIRFQSFSRASGHLLLYRQHHIKFLEQVRDRKEKAGFNHLESNVYAALHDLPTLTELAVLALYGEAVSVPYMRVVRGPGTENVNALELGPYHERVKQHITDLIECPQHLLSGSAATGALDGQDWENPELINIILVEYMPQMPHLSALLVAFLRGSLATLERLTVEFRQGGAIDQASSSERECAWMPACNDINEGALGSYRVYARNKPNTSMHAYTAQAMCSKNETEAFMRAKFTDADHAFVRAQARVVDSSGLEAERRRRQMEHDREAAETKRKKGEARSAKQAAEVERLSKITLVTDRAYIPTMTKAMLEDQLAVLRQFVPGIPLKTHLKTNAQRCDALNTALDQYTQEH